VQNLRKFVKKGKEVKQRKYKRMIMKNEIVIYQTTDNQTEVQVQFDNQTVWLTQAQMVILFERDQSVISRHIRNVFAEGELEEKSNMQNMHIANSDKSVVFYNLDVIISVGYRVKSKRGTQFRQWATQRLKDFLVQGYAINQKRLDELQKVVQFISQSGNTDELQISEAQKEISSIKEYREALITNLVTGKRSLNCDLE
jgi:hypothetical protein